MKRLAVLISNVGTGSNLQAIIDAINNKSLNAKISAVITDTKEAYGVKRAKKHNLPVIISHTKNDLPKILKKIDRKSVV